MRAGPAPPRQQWVCVYEARSGGRAHALFDSFEAAKRFAETHSHLWGGATSDAKWTEIDGSWVLSTKVGDYMIIPTS